MKDYVLGISCLYHNSAAALIKDGKIACAAEEERFTRIKGDAAFPINAVKFCLDSEGIFPEDLLTVAYYENPGIKFDRILIGAFLNMPKSIDQFLRAMPDWITNKLWIERKIRKELGFSGKIVFSSHHLSHAASCFYPSPFEDAAILTIDGVGEWSSCALGVGRGNSVELTECINYPNSLGLLYSAFTLYTGFRINNGEYKMMGLAPYGKPVYADLIKKEIVSIAEDGSFALNQKYFSYTYSAKTINKRFEELFGNPARKKDESVTPFYANVAASIQEVTNEIVFKLAKSIKEKSGCKNLVMAGGVALNVSSNGLLRKSGLFDDIWIAPAAGDAGGALGAAFEAYYRLTDEKRTTDQKDMMRQSFLGYSIKNNDNSDNERLKACGAVWEKMSSAQLIKTAASLLADGKVVGLARDEAEFGPRALGHRSILADARNPHMLEKLNLMIKFREGFRPFAPIVIKEDAKDYFDVEGDSPYMLFTFPVKESRRLPAETAQTYEATAKLVRSDIPAVTHIDYSARIQTVEKENNAFLYGILQEFKRLTGCGVLVNTSFNVNEEPIVNTAEDAYKCFMKSGIDNAVIGDRFFDKKRQPTPNKGGSEKK
ncbi:MAG: hypothetical protein IJS90_04925 [Clostridia bacterium]|nr:hypothetical protein [Clostridia bacterium]